MPLQRYSRAAFLETLQRLPERARIADTLYPNGSLKEAWINWVSNYVRSRKDSRAQRRRDARFIYNHVWNAPMLIWLSEASGVDEHIIRTATTLVSESGNSPSQAAAIRRILPWSLVVRQLQGLKTGDAAHNPGYTEHCVYTIRHSDQIAQFSRSNGPHTIDTKMKRWTGAKQMIADARKRGMLVPLLFAPAEDTTNVVACGDLLSVETGRANSCRFENVRYLSPPIRKTKIAKRDGTKINRDFIRDYALCRTPALNFTNDQRTAILENRTTKEEFEEGAAIQVLATRYERNPAARARCIKHYGTHCMACGVSMADRYGTEVAGLIHVHHLTPLATIGVRSSFHPIRDLRPVCPNCHAVIHSTSPPRTIEQVRQMVREKAL